MPLVGHARRTPRALRAQLPASHRREVVAMRERLGSFEVLLTTGTTVRFDEQARRGQYRFALGRHGVLAADRGSDQLVAIESLEGGAVVLRSSRPVALGAGDAMLVVYPLFLYEKLKTSRPGRQTNKPI
jgi:hypothetical protein